VGRGRPDRVGSKPRWGDLNEVARIASRVTLELRWVEGGPKPPRGRERPKKIDMQRENESDAVGIYVINPGPLGKQARGKGCYVGTRARDVSTGRGHRSTKSRYRLRTTDPPSLKETRATQRDER
jgi:hypothetical protein